MPPQQLRKEIYSKIKEHGGHVTARWKPEALYLVERSKMKEAPKNLKCYGTDFITDSINAKKAQRLEDYSSVESTKKPSTARRHAYTTEEKAAILYFVFKEEAQHKVTGNKLWQIAEQRRITLRSWQSMKCHYIDHLQNLPGSWLKQK
jgi:hypothetical protein